MTPATVIIERTASTTSHSAQAKSAATSSQRPFFAGFFLVRETEAGEITVVQLPQSTSYQTMIASEEILRREWDTPEEDAAWAHL